MAWNWTAQLTCFNIISKLLSPDLSLPGALGPSGSDSRPRYVYMGDSLIPQQPKSSQGSYLWCRSYGVEPMAAIDT